MEVMRASPCALAHRVRSAPDDTCTHTLHTFALIWFTSSRAAHRASATKHQHYGFSRYNYCSQLPVGVDDTITHLLAFYLKKVTLAILSVHS